MSVIKTITQHNKFYNNKEGSFDSENLRIDLVVNYLSEGLKFAKPSEMTSDKQEWLNSLQIGDKVELCYANYDIRPSVCICTVSKIHDSMEMDGVIRENYVLKGDKGRIARAFKNGKTSSSTEWIEKPGTYIFE
jgi:hypothetical protein